MEPTRLEISTLKSPIRAVVADRREGGMTIEQALPFLRLDSTIHEDPDRPAKIAHVSIRVEDNVPKLVVELEYTKKRRDDTVPYAIERPAPMPAAERASAPLAIAPTTMWQRLMTLVAAIRS